MVTIKIIEFYNKNYTNCLNLKKYKLSYSKLITDYVDKIKFKKYNIIKTN